MTPPPRTEPLQNDEHEHSVRVVSDRDIFTLNEKICYICVSNETLVSFHLYMIVMDGLEICNLIFLYDLRVKNLISCETGYAVEYGMQSFLAIAS